MLLGAYNACIAGTTAGNSAGNATEFDVTQSEFIMTLLSASKFASAHKEEYEKKLAGGESDSEATQVNKKCMPNLDLNLCQ